MFDIITIGTATKDIFLTSPLFRVVNDPKHLKKMGFPTGEVQCFALGGKIEIGRPIMTTGGGAANAATTFARQGLKTACLVKIGKDEAAENILSEFKKEKIVSFAIRDKKEKTVYSIILLAPSGERTILVHRGASEDLKTKEIPFNKLKARWAYVTPGKIPFPVLKKIFDRLVKNRTFIAFNPSESFTKMGIKKLKPFLAKSKVVILNKEEASYLTGIDYEKEKEIFKKLDRAIAGIALMTDGARGGLVSDGANIYKFGVFLKKAVDSTGAGDAFGSGFVSGLIRTGESCEKNTCRIGNIKYAIRLGAANAASVVERIGAKEGILTKKEFEKNKRWGKLKIRNYSYEAMAKIYSRPF